MEPDPGAVRNFKDFLQLYNKMTEMCFQRCVDNVNSRKLDNEEVKCVDDCSQKFITYNNKLMQYFVKTQSELVNRRMKEAEEQQKALEQQQNELQSVQSQTLLSTREVSVSST